MSNLLRVHSVVNVESDGRNENTSESPTNFIYQLTQPVNFFKRGRNYEYSVRIENARIPISFYNINEYYSVFNWVGSTTGAVSFTIAYGNYTIDELIAEIQTQMNALDANTYTLSYDEITQKVSITSDGVENITSITGNGWETIGFELTQTITGATTVAGNNVAFTNTTKHLKIILYNVNSNNVYSNAQTGDKITNLQRVALTVPITEIRNEYQFYENNEGYYIKLPNMSNIKDIRVKLVDARNNVVDLNGVPWGFDVVFYKLKKNIN